jgi:predicted amidophosphoribosyltransferase
MREKYSLCKDCWEQLPWLKQTIQRNNHSVLVACNYAYPVNRIIQQFKYEQKLHYQILLGEILKQLKFPKVQAIVPMPISNQRLIERGFN